MQAFHNDADVKAKHIERTRNCRNRGEIYQGYEYCAAGFKGAMGSTVFSVNPYDYERESEIPATLAVLEEAIFNLLPADTVQKWPEGFLIAIPIGCDLSKVWLQFAIWLLDDPKDGLVNLFQREDVRKPVQNVARLYRTNCTDAHEWCEASTLTQRAYRAIGKATSPERSDTISALKAVFAAGWLAAYANEMPRSGAIAGVKDVVTLTCEAYGFAEADSTFDANWQRADIQEKVKLAKKEAIQTTANRQSTTLLKLLATA